MRTYSDFGNMYGSYSNRYNSYSQKYQSYGNIFNQPIGGGYKDLSTKSMSDAMLRYMEAKSAHREKNTITPSRSLFDVAIDTLMTTNYMSAGFADGVVQNIKGGTDATWTTPFRQAGQGFMAGLGGVFTTGNEKHEYTYSGVIETMGWKPESTFGKLTKGTIGLVGDILLDPTTYLSGGLSAAIKGTGRVGKATTALEKLGKEMPEIAYKNRLDKFAASGISPERAESFAYREFWRDAERFKNPTHMTEEMAEIIVRNNIAESGIVKNGIPVTETVIKSDARKLAKEYNQALGIYDVAGGKPLTFGVANLPFGEKLASKMGPLGKTIHLSDARAIREMSDKLGVSAGYAALRDAIYGSRIGRLLSTKAPKFEWAQRDPRELYKLVAAIDGMKGTNVDKVARKREIHNIAKAMNLGPSEQRELIEIMENASVSKDIRAILRFSETKKANELRENLNARKENLVKEVEWFEKSFADLTELRNNARTQAPELEKELAKVEQSLLEGVTEFNKGTVKGSKELMDRISVLEGNIAKMAEERTGLTTKARELRKAGAEERVHPLASKKVKKATKDAVGARKAVRQKYLNEMNDLAIQIKEIDDLTGNLSRSQRTKMNSEIKEINAQITELSKKIQLINKAEAPLPVKGKTMTSNMDYDPARYNENHFELIEEQVSKLISELRAGKGEAHRTSVRVADEISEFVYGERGAVAPFRGESGEEMLGYVMDLLRGGHAPEFLQTSPLFRDKRVLSPRAQAVYKHLGEELGYKDFHKDVRERLANYNKKITADNLDANPEDVLNSRQLQDYYSLKDKSDMRTYLFNKYFKMDPREFNKFASDFSMEKLRNDLAGEATGMLNNSERIFDENTARKGFADNDSARFDPEVGVDRRIHERTNYNSVEQIMDDVTVQLEKMVRLADDSEMGAYTKAYQELFDSDKYSPTGRLITALDEKLAKHANGVLYEDLPASVQELYIKGIISEFIHNSSMKSEQALNYFEKSGIIDSHQKALKSAADKELALRNDMTKIETINNAVYEGQLIKLNDGNPAVVVSRRTTDDGVTFEIVKHDKSITTINALDVKSYAPGDVRDVNLLLRDDIVRKSLGDRQELLARMEKLKAKKEIIPSKYILSKADAESLQEPLREQYKALVRLRGADEAAITRSITHAARNAEYKSIKKWRKLDLTVKARDEMNLALRREKYQLSKQKKAYESYIETRKTEREALTEKLSESVKRQEALLKEHDDLLRSYNDTLESLDVAGMESNIAQIEGIEKVLKNDDTFEDYVRMRADLGEKYMDDVIKEESGFNAAMAVIDDLPLTEQQKEWGKLIRKNMWKAGMDEVKIGKLKPEQFEAMGANYIYHKATPEYEEYLRINKVENPHSSPTQDYGFNLKWANSSLSRSSKDTIAEANEKMRELLKGKNAFSEDIADIFVTRMLKHEDLMYDHQVTQTMMNRFGSTLYEGQRPKDGFKAVANFGELKEKLTADAKEAMKPELRELGAKYRQEADQLAYNKAKAIFDQYYGIHMEKGGPYGTRERRRMFSIILNGEKRKLDSTIPEDAMQKLFKKHIDESAAQYGFEPGVLDEFATPMIELTEKQIDLLSPTGMARSMNDAIVDKANMSRKIKMLKDEHATLQMYDKFLHWVKVNQTAIMPAFHVRNKYSNMFQNWLGVGTDSLDPRMQLDATKTILARGDAGKLADLKPLVSKSGDKVYHWNDLYDLATSHGVIDEGFFAQDLSKTTQSKGLFSKWIKPKYDPTSTESFKPYQIATHWGSNVENSDRLIHFASMLKQGHTVEDAAESSIKYLFDYSDLTSFERNVMKRVIPYYTWIRKNARLQVGELIEQPEKYRMVGKIHHGIEGSVNEEDKVDRAALPNFAEDWIQTPFMVSGANGQKNPVMLSPNMPYMDIARLFNPANPIDSLREIFTATTPVLKLPIEFGANWNSFFDDEIAKDGEGKAKAYSKHIASQLAPYNAVRNIAGTEDTKQALHVLNTLTGVKLMPHNEQMAYVHMYEQMYKEEGRKRQFRRMLDVVANKVGNTALYVADSISDLAEDGVVNLIGQPPTRAEDYTGALRPISVDTYNELPSAEKKLYEAPSKSDVAVYNKMALEMEEQAYSETGQIKKFVWALFDSLDSSPKKAYARVTSVADGDTFSVNLAGKEESVRILLVDTPETVDPRLDGPQPYGQEASDFASSMLFGQDVSLQITGKDRYDRTLAFVELDGTDFNKLLLEEGYAQVRYLQGVRDRKRIKEYFKAERDAYKQNKGIWEIPDYGSVGKDSGFNTWAIPD